MKAIELLVDGVIFQSRGECRRAIAQGAIKINGVKIEDAEQEVEISKDVAVEKGKKVFLNGKEWTSKEISAVAIAKFGRIKDSTTDEEAASYRHWF